jgi:hypothetical protein
VLFRSVGYQVMVHPDFFDALPTKVVIVISASRPAYWSAAI